MAHPGFTLPGMANSVPDREIELTFGRQGDDFWKGRWITCPTRWRSAVEAGGSSKDINDWVIGESLTVRSLTCAMTFTDEAERIRVRIEIAMGQRYANEPDCPCTRAAIARDLHLLNTIFPELDITATIDDDFVGDDTTTPTPGRLPALSTRA